MHIPGLFGSNWPRHFRENWNMKSLQTTRNPYFWAQCKDFILLIWPLLKSNTYNYTVCITIDILGTIILYVSPSTALVQLYCMYRHRQHWYNYTVCIAIDSLGTIILYVSPSTALVQLYCMYHHRQSWYNYTVCITIDSLGTIILYVSPSTALVTGNIYV
jgi:hypothetical protein